MRGLRPIVSSHDALALDFTHVFRLTNSYDHGHGSQ
jgi:hypothetical protein